MRSRAPIRLAGALAVLALLAPQARGQEQLDLADRLYERAEIGAQIRPIASQFQQGLEEYRGKMSDDAIAALVEAGKKSFSEDALHQDIVTEVAKRLKAEDMRRALDWLDGLPGRRVTHAEARAAASMSRESMQAYLEVEKGKRARPKRDAMIAQLIEATKAVEIGAGFIEATSLGIAVGMDATQPVEKRIGIAGLRSRLREAMPPEKLRADVGTMLPPMYGYVYREITDADLAAYVRFLGSPAGRRYSDAVSGALIGTLARASVRVGEMLPAAAEKKQI